MIRDIREHKIITCLELIIEHPIEEISEVSMFVSRYLDNNTYIFCIPYHNWTYEKENGKEINFPSGPSSFKYEKYKHQLINAMNEAIEIIENNKMNFFKTQF